MHRYSYENDDDGCSPASVAHACPFRHLQNRDPARLVVLYEVNYYA